MSATEDAFELLPPNKKAAKYFKMIEEMLTDKFTGSTDIVKIFQAAGNTPIIDPETLDLRTDQDKKGKQFSDLIILPLTKGMDFQYNKSNKETEEFSLVIRNTIALALIEYQKFNDNTKQNITNQIAVLQSIDNILKTYVSDEKLTAARRAAAEEKKKEKLAATKTESKEDQENETLGTLPKFPRGRRHSTVSEESVDLTGSQIDLNGSQDLSSSRDLSLSTIISGYKDDPEGQEIAEKVKSMMPAITGMTDSMEKQGQENIIKTLFLAKKAGKQSDIHEILSTINTMTAQQKSGLRKVISMYEVTDVLPTLLSLKNQKTQNDRRMLALPSPLMQDLRAITATLDPLNANTLLSKFAAIPDKFRNTFLANLKTLSFQETLNLLTKIMNEIEDEPQKQKTLCVLLAQTSVLGNPSHLVQMLNLIIDQYEIPIDKLIPDLTITDSHAGTSLIDLLAYMFSFAADVEDAKHLVQFSEENHIDTLPNLLNSIKTLRKRLEETQEKMKTSLKNPDLQKYLRRQSEFSKDLVAFIEAFFDDENFSLQSEFQGALTNVTSILNQAKHTIETRLSTDASKPDEGKGKGKSSDEANRIDISFHVPTQKAAGRAGALLSGIKKHPLKPPKDIIERKSRTTKGSDFIRDESTFIAQNEKNKEEIKALQEQLAQKQIELQAASNQIGSLETQVDALKREKQQARAEKEALGRELADERQQFENERKRFEEELRRMREEMKAAQEKALQHQEALAASNAARRDAQQKTTEYQVALGVAQGQIAALHKEGENANTALDRERRAHEETRRQAEDRQAAALVAANTAHGAREAALRVEIEREQKEKEEAQRLADQRQTTLLASNAARDAAQQQAIDSQARIANLERQLAEARGLYDADHAALGVARGQLDNLNVIVPGLQAQANLVPGLQAQTAQIPGLQAQVAQIPGLQAQAALVPGLQAAVANEQALRAAADANLAHEQGAHAATQANLANERAAHGATQANLGIAQGQAALVPALRAELAATQRQAAADIAKVRKGPMQ